MKTDIDTIPNLYSITGNVLDINTVLINREELRKLIEAKEELLEFAQGLGDVPCPLEVYVWLYKYNILDMRKAVITKHKD